MGGFFIDMRMMLMYTCGDKGEPFWLRVDLLRSLPIEPDTVSTVEGNLSCFANNAGQFIRSSFPGRPVKRAFSFCPLPPRLFFIGKIFLEGS
jgi:hypothetical protein